MNSPVQIEQTKIPAARSPRRSFRIGALLTLTAMVLALSACAGIERPPRAEARTAQTPFAAPAQPHATLEAAAHAALLEAWSGTTGHNRDQLRVGAILQNGGDFTWLEPQRSKAGHVPVVRLGLHADHAATYIVHPRTGSAAVDRANERITRGEKRLVDRVDPLHRPIFVLTPSGRLLSYSHGAPVVEMASMRDRNQSFKAAPKIRIGDLDRRR